MSKEVEALDRLYDNVNWDDYFFRGDASEDYDLIEKALKALKIIKEKKVDVEQIIENPDWDKVIWYNTSFTGILCEGWRMLTQEEYNLLREVLLCK